MSKLNYSRIPENRKAENDSELLQYLSRIIKDKVEIRKMNYKMLSKSITLMAIVIIPSIIALGLFEYFGLNTGRLFDALKIFYAAIGIYGVGLIGLSRVSSE